MYVRRLLKNVPGALVRSRQLHCWAGKVFEKQFHGTNRVTLVVAARMIEVVVK